MPIIDAEFTKTEKEIDAEFEQTDSEMEAGFGTIFQLGVPGPQGEKGDKGLDALVCYTDFNGSFTSVALAYDQFNRTPVVGDLFLGYSSRGHYHVFEVTSCNNNTMVAAAECKYYAQLIGPKGPQGPQGPQGYKGEKGDAGENGLCALVITKPITLEYAVGDAFGILKGDFNRTPVAGDVFATLCGGGYYTVFNVFHVGENYANVECIARTWIKGDPGQKGDPGEKGDPGSDANVTKANVEAALGYTPVDRRTVAEMDESLTHLIELSDDFNGDIGALYHTTRALEERMDEVALAATSFEITGTFEENGDGTYAVTLEPYDWDEMMDAYHSGRLVMCHLNEDGARYLHFMPSEIYYEDGYAVFHCPGEFGNGYELQIGKIWCNLHSLVHLTTGSMDYIIANVIDALPVYDGEVVDV